MAPKTNSSLSDDDLSFDDILEEELKRSKHGPTCGVCLALPEMEPSLRASLERAINMPDDKVTSASISRAIKRKGYNISADKVIRHRKNECGWRT